MSTWRVMRAEFRISLMSLEAQFAHRLNSCGQGSDGCEDAGKRCLCRLDLRFAVPRRPKAA